MRSAKSWREGATYRRSDQKGAVMRIGTKLVVSLVLSTMVVMVVYRYWRLLTWHKTLFAQQAREVRMVAKALEVAVENAMKREQWEDVKGFFQDIQGLSGIDRVTLFRADGSVLVASDPSLAGATASAPMIRQVLQEKKPTGFFSEEEGGGHFHYLTPMRLAWQGTPSVLEVIASTSFTEQILAKRRNEIVFGGLFMMIVIAFLAWYFTQRNLSRPIGDLIQGAMAIGSGDLSPRIPVKRKDELGCLAAEFNRMAEGLEHAREQFLEETRKKLNLERQLQHSEKLAAVGRLAAGLAHEIGTPLNIISGRAEYLLPEMEEGDPKAKNLRAIITQIERIARIIEQLLGYARAHPPQIAPTSLPRVLSNVLSFLDHEMKRRGSQVEPRFPTWLPELAADPHLLQQVFVNLLLNAFDAMPEGGQVRIVAEVKEGWVEISVEDTGCGIPADYLPQIFDPFFTTKKPGKGTGLGLSVVHGIIQNHGGRIEVRSEVGVGTTFFISLPLYSTEAQSPGPHLETSSEGPGGYELFVRDGRNQDGADQDSDCRR